MITDDEMNLIIRDWTEQPTTLRRGGLHRALAQVEVTAQQAPPTARRFQTMFTATKFVIAGVIVALSGGAVFTGVMTKGPRDESSPAAISPASAALPDASTGALDPLSSAVDINVEHVTLLDDGRVLVIGRAGKGHEGITVAEVWDPETDAFSAAGSLAPDTEIRSATLLSDGRVLVIGRAGKGREGGAVAEVWDPETGVFSSAGSLPPDIDAHATTLLSDGRVLVIGRGGKGREGGAMAEVWDPETGAFSPTGALAAETDVRTATLLSDGRVLVIGRGGKGREGGAVAEVWDPETGTFSPAGSLAVEIEVHVAPSS